MWSVAVMSAMDDSDGDSIRLTGFLKGIGLGPIGGIDIAYLFGRVVGQRNTHKDMPP